MENKKFNREVIMVKLAGMCVNVYNFCPITEKQNKINCCKKKVIKSLYTKMHIKSFL